MSDREWPVQSALIMIAGLLLGVVGDLFFYSHPPGANIFLYVVVFLLAAAGLVYAWNEKVNPTNALFFIPALFFAAMLAVISAPFLSMFNVLVMIGALFVGVRYLTHPAFLGGQIERLVVDAIETAILGWIEPLVVLEGASKWVRTRKTRREQHSLIEPVVRGCLIALPILIVFVALLSSADVVFGDFFEGLVGWINFGSLENFIPHILVIGFFAWCCMAAFKIMLLNNAGAVQQAQAGEVTTEGDLIPAASPLRSFIGEEIAARMGTVSAPKPKAAASVFRLGMVESGIVLGSVNMLFLVFVLIQARYFFGGEANITRQGYTYAEYARRGFFELLAVSIFTLLLILVLDHFTRRADQQERLFRALVLGMIGLVLVILVSAFQRLSLYEEAYGFTRLRVVSHIFTVWLAILFVVRAVDLFRVYPRLFWLGGIVCTFGFFATLNLLNVDAFIAERNIDRFHDTGKLDVDYLISLSDDAVPAMVTLLDELDRIEHDYERQWLVSNLRGRLHDLDTGRDERRFLGYHYGKNRAWKALDERRVFLINYGTQ